MFTGIIEHTAKITRFEKHEEGAILHISNPWNDIALGESIAVNGVCLTSTSLGNAALCFGVSSETLAVTNFKRLLVNETVNLERALQGSSRMGGHYVSGHVDDTACIAKMRSCGDYIECSINAFCSESAPLYLLPKASITIDGISLTINKVESGQIFIMLVPHTIQTTNLAARNLGDSVNIEYDYLARVVAHQLHTAGQLPDEVQR